MKAIIFGVGAVLAYSLIVGVKSLIGLFRYDKEYWPTAFAYLAYLVLVPATFAVPGLYPDFVAQDFENHSLWKVCLLLLMICVWLVLGLFIRATYQKIITGELYWKPRAVAKKRVIIGAIAAVIGISAWLAGLYGYLDFLEGWWEKSAIILSLYLAFQGLLIVGRNWKFMLHDEPEARIKTVSDGPTRKQKKAENKSRKPAPQHISYKGQKKKKADPAASAKQKEQ